MNGWTECIWGELATLEYGRGLRQYRSEGQLYPVYGTNGQIGWHNEALANGAGVIIGRKGAYRGVHYSRQPFFVIDTAFYLKPKTELDMRWAYYHILTQDITGLDSGSAIPSTSRDDFYRLSVTLPPLPIQRRIAEILGRLDDKIEVNRRIDRTLEAMAQALYRHWFVEFGPFRDGEFVESELGMIPKGWEAGRLSNLCSTQYGYTASATDKPVGPKLLRVTDINKRNWIEWGSVPHCVISADDRSKYALEVGDIVVARMADPGKSAIVEEAVDAVFASYLVRLKTNSLAYAYFVYEFLKSPQYGEYAEGAKGGSVQANMNAKIIVGADLVIPPVPVLAAFLAKVLPLRQRLVASVKESSVLASVRDYLLPKLLSGEVEAVGAAVHE